jgi:hypothetical protein
MSGPAEPLLRAKRSIGRSGSDQANGLTLRENLFGEKIHLTSFHLAEQLSCEWSHRNG